VTKNITEVVIPSIDKSSLKSVSKLGYYISEFLLLLYIGLHIACCAITSQVEFYLKAKDLVYM